MMHDTIDLPKLRETLGLTQADLAGQAGVDVATVWRWEKNGIPKRGSARAFIERLAQDAEAKRAAA
jgi:transcriptional regulator with XRE-family HTH domain